MTDITTIAPITTRKLSLPRLPIPRVGIGASLAAIAELWGDGFNLSCVDPFTNLRREPPVIQVEDLEGRDPNW